MAPPRPHDPDNARLLRLEDQLGEVRHALGRQDAVLEHIAASVDQLADGLRAARALEPRVVELERVETRRRSVRKWLVTAVTPVVVAVVLVLLGLK